MKLLIRAHPLLFALIVASAFVAGIQAIPKDVSALDERVWQGFTVLPRSLPEDAHDDNRQVYMVINNKGNDDQGNGAYIPDTTIKVYSQGPPSETGRQITIYPRSGCHRNVTLSYANWILGEDNKTNESKTHGDAGYDTRTTGACDPITWTLPSRAFAESSNTRHQGLWIAVVTFETDNPDGTEEGYYGVKFRAQAHGGSRLGYQGGSLVNLSTANVGPRNHGLRQYDINFADTCSATNQITFYWGDDDYGTKEADEPDTPGAGPEDTLLPVNFAAWSAKTKIKLYNQTDPSFHYSEANEYYRAGHLQFPKTKDGNYAISFFEVDPNNGITFEYPRDSADFYLPCPNAPPITATAPSCDFSGKAITGIAYDNDNLGKNIQVEAYLNAGRKDGGTFIGRVNTVGPGYYLMNVDAAMGSPPNGTFVFYVYAIGIDPYGNPDGVDGGPVIVSATCGTFHTKGCPSMVEGMQDITVPDRDGIPASDAMPGEVPQEQKDKEIKLRNPTGNHGEQWEHAVLKIYDQWGQESTVYSPWGWTTNPTFKIDYTAFMKKYPYDYHAISVMYATKYNELTYRYDNVVGHYCDNGGNLVGTNCVQSYPANTPTPEFPERCPFGGTYQPADKRCYTGVTPAKNKYGPRLINVDFKQMWWSYGLAPPSSIGFDNNYWTNGGTPILNPCYNRTYEAEEGAMSVSQPLIMPNNENPTSVNMQFQFGVRYGLVPRDPAWVEYEPQSPQVRSQFTAIMHYRANYYLKRGGSLVPLYSQSSSSGDEMMPKSWYTGGPLITSKTAAPGISVPPVRAGDQVCAGLEVWYKNGEMKNDGGDPVFGDRPLTQQIDNTDAARLTVDPQDHCSAPVTNEPYAHFFGGDVIAGPGFSEGESCVVDPSGNIKTLTRSTGPLPKGSGAQYAAMALGEIQGLSSANLRKVFPTASTGLSFSNTENLSGGGIDAPNLGGKLGQGGNYCIPDYFGTMPKETPVDTSATTAPVGVSGAQHYKPAGGKIKIDGGTVPAGTRQAIYIENADLYIGGNIELGGARGGWSSLAEIPSLYIIVKNGNVRIDPSVTNLDGIYIAQPSGNSKGVISTCGTPDRTFSTYEIFNNCKNQLVVNGAFVARQVLLNRSFGSLRYAERYSGASGESPLYGTAHVCGEAGSDIPVSGPLASNDCAAEIFNFSPEFYLAQPAITPSSGPASAKYDSFTSLSPVL